MTPDHNAREPYEILEGFDTFLEHLHNVKGFDRLPADFEPYHFRIFFLAIMGQWSLLSGYLWSFRIDRDRSREFHYDIGMWSAVVVTQFMRYLRKLPSYSR